MMTCDTGVLSWWRIGWTPGSRTWVAKIAVWSWHGSTQNVVLAAQAPPYSPAEPGTLAATGSRVTALPRPYPTPGERRLGELRPQERLHDRAVGQVVSGHVLECAGREQPNPAEPSSIDANQW